MKYKEFGFVDTAFGGVANRNKVEHIAQLSLPGEKTDCYITYFRFRNDYAEHCSKTGSVSGYNGECFASWLFVDIDDPNNLAEAHRIVKNLLLYVETELEIHLKEIEIYFSGAKGFHVGFPESLFDWKPSADLPKVHRAMAKHLFSAYNVDFSIYDKNRLFRIPNSIHSKTGLYKVLLTPSEVLYKSIDEIKKIAENPRKIERLEFPEKNQFLHDVYKQHSEQGRFIEPEREIVSRKTKLADYFSNIGEGQRNDSCFHVAYELRNRGLYKNEVREIVKIWNRVYCDPCLEEKEISRTIDSAFRFQGKTKAERLDKLKTIKDIEHEYREYLKLLKTHGLNFNKFIPSVAKHISPIFPGNVIGFAAGTGVGKTTFLQNCLYHWKIPALNVNLEMPGSSLYESYQQLSNNLHARDIRKMYEDGQGLDTQHLEHIITLDDTRINIDEIVEYWQIAQEKIGKEILVISIDHAGLLKASGKNEYERMTEIGNNLIELAKITKTIVFALSQVPRETAKDGDVPLTVTSPKGSGALENGMRLLLGAYRPQRTRKKLENNVVVGDDKMIIQILKQTHGVDGLNFEVSYDGATRRIYEESRQLEYEKLLSAPGDDVPF